MVNEELLKEGAAAADAEGMKSLRSALRVMMAFCEEQQDFGVGELAERCKLSKSQVSKVLSTFAEFGLLTQNNESRRYQVGSRLYALGSRYLNFNSLCRGAMPVMRDLVESTGHSARLSVLDGDRVLYLLGIEGPLFMDTGWRAGTWLPVHATSSGRVLLATMDPERARRLRQQQIPVFTDRTITDFEEIEKRVELARQEGFSVQRGETAPGLGVISAPVYGRGGQPLGTLGLAFPSHVVPTQQEPQLIDALHGACRVLSQRVGCTVYPHGHAAVAH
jgi:DNA-binding IclR family transcriptional regulator